MFRAVNPSLELNGDFWAWHLDYGHAGFPPHRDRWNMTETDGLPDYLSAWVALTDVTPSHGCIFVLPCSLDPTYGRPVKEGEEEEDDADSVARANCTDCMPLPAHATDVLFWTGRLIHYGGRCTSRTPRMSLGLAASNPTFESPADRLGPTPRRLDNLLYPSLEDRLRIIATQIWTYNEVVRQPRAALNLLEALEVHWQSNNTTAAPLETVSDHNNRTSP